jgi:hypothetical protein
VAQSLVHLGQREGYRTCPIEFALSHPMSISGTEIPALGHHGLICIDLPRLSTSPVTLNGEVPRLRTHAGAAGSKPFSQTACM